jgi:hypothetical protein
MEGTPHKLVGEMPHCTKHNGVGRSHGELRSVGRERQKHARRQDKKQSSSE